MALTEKELPTATDQLIDNVMHVMLQCFGKQSEYLDRRFEQIETDLAEIKALLKKTSE